MRYILTILLCLLTSSPSWAFPPGFIGAVTQSGGAEDYCSGKLGSYSLYYDVDHPDGTGKACISGATTDVTFTSVTASDTVNSTSGGTYGVLWDGLGNKYANVPATGITSSNGRIEFDVIFTGTVPTATFGLMEWSYSASASLYAKVQYSGGNYRISFYHYDGTTTNIGSAFTYTALSANTAYHVIVDWNSTTTELYTSFNGQSGTSSAGTVGAFSNEPTKGVRFGEDIWSEPANQSFGFDNIVMGASQQ